MTGRQDAWIAALLGAPIADEPAATCASCAMTTSPPGAVRFDEGTKCCTWMPQLPNFLAGPVVDVASVGARIDAGIAVTPLGLGVPRAYARLHKAREATFGRSDALGCPHLADGQCTIWSSRQATCATWFCKFERGRVGADLWGKLHKLLTWLEWGVARWAARELGIADAALDVSAPSSEDQTTIDLDRDESPDVYAGVWGAWAGRERELYREAARLADGVTLDDALARSPLRVRIFAEDVRAAAAAVADRAPPVLVRLGTSFRIVHEDRDRVVFEAYSSYDPLVLRPDQLQKLPRFDGRPLADVLAENPEISPALARRLLDVGILKLRADVAVEYTDDAMVLVDARLDRRVNLGPRGAAFVAGGKPDDAIARRLLLLGLFDEEMPSPSAAAARVQLPGARFACQGSGACCRNHLLGPVTPDEARRIDELAGAGPHVEERDGRLYLRRDARGRCTFLVDDRRCGLHARFGAEAKPATCRLFPIELVPTILGVRVVDKGTCASFPASARAGLPLVDQVPAALAESSGARFHPAVHVGDDAIVDFVYWLRVTDAAIARLPSFPSAPAALGWLGRRVAALGPALATCAIEPAEPRATIDRLLGAPDPGPSAGGDGAEVATLVLDELVDVAREADVFGPLGEEIAAMLRETSRSLLDDPPGSRVDDDTLRLGLAQQLFGRRSVVAERARPALLRLALLFLCAARAPNGYALAGRLLELGAAQSVLLQHEELAAPILDALPGLLA